MAEDKWPCPECGEEFATDDKMAEHYNEKHIGEVDDSFYDDDSFTITTIS